jgi:xanthine/uracil permease
MDAKSKDLIESIVLLVCLTILKLAFLGAGVYLLMKDFFGCGITCLIFAFITSGHHTSERKDKE